ncbi:DUF1735 domain-containing protein [Marinilabilia rubra]|uniref:BT-3987-like N-terminal domain-containing protein n=1 Tax=Marinilabilia rubra TaxID=2162893 RepID=A0A2U2BE80_9BACT|nr:DUF1735 domain-containing protein [Marinilabilia rubra]PWE01380.1 hypothetical protein DDZ16_02525 [Marinilabilia rubra]
MNIKFFISAVVLFSLAFFGCEKYDDYVEDYTHSTVYFGAQHPLRTVVARGDDMQIKLGVVLAGKRQNNDEEWVTYSIEPSLLDEVNQDEEMDVQLELLPEEYYTLADEKQFTIHKGELLGEIEMTIDHDLFVSDPNAMNTHYALPLQIQETSADSVNATKDYTIVAIKYISEKSGYYYSKGAYYELDESGEQYVDTSEFWNKDLTENDFWYLETLGLDSLETLDEAVSSASHGVNLRMKIEDNNQVVIEPVVFFNNILEGGGTYDPENKSFYLDFKYEQFGNQYHVLDTLIQMHDPEKDLRFEEY